MPYKKKICPQCGTEFQPHSSKQKYCNRDIVKTCPICGKQFKSICNPSSPPTCGVSKCAQTYGCLHQKKICPICGEEFTPNSTRQKYCHKPIKKICVVCGKEFESTCGDLSGRQTCRNPECEHKYAHMMSENAWKQTTRTCKWCGQPFHPKNNTQVYCERTHYQTCKQCGKKFEIDVTKFEINGEKQFCSNDCRYKYMSEHNPFKDPVARVKASETLLKHYGVEHPFQSPKIRETFRSNYKKRTGYDHPSQNPEVRKKQLSSVKKKNMFEERVKALLENYSIKYNYHYMISNETGAHEFDFYLPDYKILIDCDGVYYHSYLSDPDGKGSSESYDETRLALIPKDHIFHVIVEGQEEKDIKTLQKILKAIDYNIFNYDSELFKWCRETGFPYAHYTMGRMADDYFSLMSYSSLAKYNPTCMLGMSIIENFHRSIYDCRCGNKLSPVEAWNNDKMLKEVIANRLIYKNDVDPHKIMKGFNISKTCPTVSRFNPVLAKYLTYNYLNEFDTVFDPFSGFSGRLLGVTSLGKHYIGHDLNETAVKESNQIINFLNLSELATISVKDILESSGEYECLLTCPPYGTKEIYSHETVFKSCDDWIDECLKRFDCNKYVFVVDHTEKYKDYVEEEIHHSSHFVKTKEQVVVLERNQNGTTKM